MTVGGRPELDGPVRDYIALVLGDKSHRVLEFLDQAQQILSDPTPGPRGPETIAYCLRESLTALVEIVPKGDLSRRDAAVRALVRERDNYDTATPGPARDGALASILGEIDKLRDLEHLERFDEHRLTQFLRHLTGQEPLSLQDAAPRQYRAVVRRLNTAVHGCATPQEAKDLWDEVVTLLNRVLTPPEIRDSELAEIAQRTSPDADDVSDAKRHLITLAHLSHFLGHVDDPTWLARLESEDVIGLTGDVSWTVHTVAGTFGKGHPKAVVAWFLEIYESSPKSDVEARTVAQAAASLGNDAVPLLTRITRSHTDASWLPLIIDGVLPELPPEHGFVDDVAGVLLTRLVEPGARFSGATGRRYYSLQDIVRHLVSGTDASTAKRRYRLLCRLLERVPVEDYSVRHIGNAGESLGRAETADLDGFDFPLEMLIDVWVQVALRAREWVGVDDLLGGVDAVPAVLRQRLRSWLLTLDLRGREHLATQHIADGIRERWPNGDDRQLVDGIEDCEKAVAARVAWREAMGVAPDIPTLSAALRQNSSDVDWERARVWASALPDEATVAWHDAIAVMDNHYGGPVTEMNFRSGRTAASVVGSPMDREELMTLHPLEACRRIAAWRPETNQIDVNARALGQTLEEVVVSAEDDRWIRNPVQVVCALRQPTYIAHYVTGVTMTLRDRKLPEAASELLDVVQLVENPSWNIVALGQPEFDFDADWKCAQDVTIDLLKMMAHSDTGFAGREREAWDLLDKHVRSSEEPGEFYGDDARDLVTAAINWRRTRALEAAIAFVRWERRAGREIREEARNLLAYAVGLGGGVGLLCRAIIACNLHVLEYACPGWLADNMNRLFEDDSPGNFSNKTLELALEWARAPALRQVLEAYPQKVEEASVAGDRQAFVRYVQAMVHGVSGYTVERVLECVRKNGTLADSLGSVLRNLLPSDAEDATVESVLDFWRRSIHNGPKAMLPQFGWLAVVDRIGDEIWTERTLETLQKTRGRVAGQIKKSVAERAAGLTPSREALRIMDHLVRDPAPLDHVLVFPAARKLMDKSRDLAGSDEYRRLKAALAERGARE